MSQDNLVQFEDYVSAAKRQRRLIGVIVVGFVVLALVATLLMPERYTSESRVLVRPVLDPSDQRSEEVNIDTERGVAKSLSVAAIAAGKIGSEESPGALLGNLSVEPVTDSQILVFRYTDADADAAFEAAGAFAESYLQFRTEEADSANEQIQQALEDERDDLIERRAGLQEGLSALEPDDPDRTEIEAELAVIQSNEASIRTDLAELRSPRVDAGTVIDAAEVPTAPSSPDLKLNLAAGLLVGTVVGLLVAFLRERRNLGAPVPAAPAVEPVAPAEATPAGDARSAADRRSSVPVDEVLIDHGIEPLGSVPRLTNDADAPPFDSVTMLNGHVGDSLRAVDAALTARLEGTGRQVLLVTTPERRGITAGLAGSLAVTAAQTGREVLLIGADLAQPTLHTRFQLANHQGLVETLRGQRPLAQVMQGWGGYETLVIVTAGQSAGADPLDRSVLATRLAPVRDDFQLVLIEAPPVLASPDALTLASVCDGAILAVDPRGSRSDRIAAAAEELQSRTTVVGSVMIEARSRGDGGPPPGSGALAAGSHR